MVGFSLLMSRLVFRVGQVSIIQLAFTVALLWALDRHKPTQAGLLFPWLLIKPNLMLLFLPATWYIGKKKYIQASILALIIILGISFILFPDWLTQMTRLIIQGQARNDYLVWDFTTLAGILGLPRMWNYVFAPFLLAYGIALSYYFKDLPNFTWLIFVLALSLLIAPYSFAYDQPMLIPILIYLSRKRDWQALVLWVLAALIPYVSHYSSYSYLLTLIVLIVAIYNLMRDLQNEKSPMFIAKHDT